VSIEIARFVLESVTPRAEISAPPGFHDDPRAWSVAFEFARRLHALLPFLLRVDRADWKSELPAPTREAIDAALTRERMGLALLDGELEAALAWLAEDGIPVIVLKGMDVGRRFYPERLLRPMTDVDLLVRAEDFGRAFARMRARGDRAVGTNAARRQRIELARAEGAPIVELHGRLLRGNRGESDIWDRRIEDAFPDLPNASALSATDCLSYLIRHAAVQHQIESPIWLSDIHFLIGRSSPDWRALTADLRENRSLTAGWFLLSLLRDHWGTAIPIEVIEELRGVTRPLNRSALERLRRPADWFPFAPRGWGRVAYTRFLLRDRTLDVLSYALRYAGSLSRPR
jgi:hypothetical protein